MSKRDFNRVKDKLSEFGDKFKVHKNKKLQLTIYGSNNLKPIIYRENRGSAQCKSSVILGSMRTNGYTTIIAKQSRNHTELLAKYLKLPIKLNNFKSYDLIKVNRVKNKKINYEILLI